MCFLKESGATGLHFCLFLRHNATLRGKKKIDPKNTEDIKYPKRKWVLSFQIKKQKAKQKHKQAI